MCDVGADSRPTEDGTAALPPAEPLRKQDIIPLLLAACPDFEPHWQKHLELWEGDSPGIYADVSAFADYIAGAHRQSDSQTVRGAFEVLERFLMEGDAETQEVAVIGLIEGIQNSALRAKSPEAWNQLNDFWEGVGGGV